MLQVARRSIIHDFTSQLVIDDLAEKEGLMADGTTVEDQIHFLKAQADQVWMSSKAISSPDFFPTLQSYHLDHFCCILFKAGNKFDAAKTRAALEATLKREAVLDWAAQKTSIKFIEEQPEQDDSFLGALFSVGALCDQSQKKNL